MDRTLLDEFLKTLVSAYVWVASADEGVDEGEHVKFEHALVQSPFATQFNQDHVRRYFKDMVAMFGEDFLAASELTKTRLLGIRTNGAMAEEVVRVSRAAVVGDGDVEESEELALAEIAKCLGLEANI